MSLVSTRVYYMIRGKTLKVFVMGEEPNSFKSVELANWTGQAFIGERRHISNVKKRSELNQPGVYFLLADSPESDFTEIYIGESDEFDVRIRRHDAKKDWWTKFVVFISKDRNLTKAHIKYLEKKLFSLATESIGTLKVRNESEPSGAKLPESDIADMEVFLENMIFTLEALGLGYFATRPVTKIEIPKYQSEDKMEEYECSLQRKYKSKKGELLKATLQSIGGRYVLKAGSYIRRDIQPSFRNHPYYSLSEQVVNSRNVKESEISGILVLTKDIEFKSPSAAGAVVKGRSTNGRTAWKRKTDNKTLGLVESQ